jgi:outer membrane protein TolC
MFTVGLTYTLIGDRQDMVVPESGRDAVLPQVGVSIPLFGSRYSAMEEQAQLREQAARYDFDDAGNRLLTTLDEKLRDYRDAGRRFDLNRRLHALAASAHDVLLEDYSAGKATLDDVLAVERDMLRYALAREQAAADVNTGYDYIMYLTAQG